jgi:hypothetical protein
MYSSEKSWPSENSGTRGEEESGMEKNKATKAAKNIRNITVLLKSTMLMSVSYHN